LPNQTRLVRILTWLIGYGFPIVGSGVGFFILYNNVKNGFINLFIILCANLAIFVISKRIFQNDSLISRLRFGCVMAITVIVSILLLETAFPFLLPQDYSQTSDFTKTNSIRDDFKDFQPDLVFDYSRDKQGNTKQVKDILSEKLTWHKPGGTFVYFGYDPNRKTRYINRIMWNKTGYFDHEYSVNKPSKVYRVVLIGDSYVESVQAPLESTFHKLTESALNQSETGYNSRKYQFIALGNSGFGQESNFEVLRTQGMKYDPDLVIMTLCGNDFCDDDPELKRELVAAGGSVTPVVRQLAHHGFVAMAFMKKRIEDISRNRIKISPELLQWSREDLPVVEKAWSRTMNYVRTSRDYCESRGAAFLLMYVGSEIEVRFALDPEGTLAALRAMGGPHETMTWDISRSVSRVQKYCDEFHINFVNLVGPLARAQQTAGKTVFADHYSLFGQEVVADSLTCFMKEYTMFGKTMDQALTSCFSD
jgi:hypothetical protein